jgi:hypothetical protein
MRGDERVRFCGDCKKHVYNLSSLEADLAERLLEETNNGVCVTYYQRRDGTVLHQDCSVGQRDKRRRSLVVAVGASVVAALQAACGASAAELTSDGGVQADAGAEQIALSNAAEGVALPVLPKAVRQPLVQTGADDLQAQPVVEDSPCTGKDEIDQPTMIRGEPAPARPATESDSPIRPLMGKPTTAMMTGGLGAYPDPSSGLVIGQVLMGEVAVHADDRE